MRPWFRIGIWSDDTPEKKIPYVCVSRVGIHFNNDDAGYNAHWYDLRHAQERYSVGERRWIFFFKQIGRGLYLVFTGRML